MEQPRIIPQRRSIQQLSLRENKSDLDKVVQAFQGIQQLDPDDDNSFFKIAGYHGEPWAVSGDNIGWGGYCFHEAVLFPTWHRAYCLRIEKALQSIPGCGDVMLPFWDELADANTDTPVPAILTSPTYVLNNRTIDNPLFSYTLQQSLKDPGTTSNSPDRYTKTKGYKTVRFPLSGLVGTPTEKDKTEVWNSKWSTQVERNNELNWNVRNWMSGDVIIDRIKGTPVADTTSIAGRFKKCMEAPNWTVFSNKASAVEYTAMHHHENDKDRWVVSLEEPHNGIHLSLGGMFQKGVYNADPKNYEGANGDMGANEVAAFDPIFFLHHCFIDYAMWSWQRLHEKTMRGSLEIDYSIKKGTVMEKGNAAMPKGGQMRMDTPLVPFKKPGSDEFYTSDDVTNIMELNYIYGPGSLDSRPSWGNFGSSPPDLLTVAQTAVVDKAKYNGSFVIRTYATVDGKKVEIGRDPILSRYNIESCQNCQNNLGATAMVPLYQDLADVLDPKGTKKIPYTVEIQYLGGQEEWRPDSSNVGGGFASQDQYIRY